MNRNANLFDFYSSVCACPNTNLQCPGIVNCISKGCPPRGFYTECTEAPVPIMAVGKNPGHLLPDEAALYQNRSAREIAQSHIEYADRVFNDKQHLNASARRSTQFHRNLRRYVAHFLEVPASDVFKYLVYTNLVKCSTIGEQDILRSATIVQCFGLHLAREIKYFRPRVLLALGGEVEKYLLKSQAQQLHQLPVIRVKHPSYFYPRASETRKLDDLKDRIQNHLKRNM